MGELLGLERQVQRDLVIQVTLGSPSEDDRTDASQYPPHAGRSTCADIIVGRRQQVKGVRLAPSQNREHDLHENQHDDHDLE